MDRWTRSPWVMRGERFTLLLLGMTTLLVISGITLSIAERTLRLDGAMQWSIASGLAACTVMAGASWMRTALDKARRMAALEERQRIARELHDTLVQDCTSVSMMLEAAVGGEEATRGELLELARVQCRRVVDEARCVIWNLRETGQRTDLLEALSEIADKMTLPADTVLTVRYRMDQLRLPAYSVEEVCVAVREALRNAAQHSGAKRIVLEVKKNRNELHICIQDFGSGASTESKKDAHLHFGIVGMQERMRRFGGGVWVNAVPGLGTTVRLTARYAMLQRGVSEV